MALPIATMAQGPPNAHLILVAQYSNFFLSLFTMIYVNLVTL